MKISFSEPSLEERAVMFRGIVLAITLIFGITLCMPANTEATENRWQEYEKLGDTAKETDDWLQAEEAYEKAISLLGQTHPHKLDNEMALLLNKLGEVRFRKKDFKGAETAHRRALTIYDWNLGPEDPKVAETLDLLGTSFFNQETGRALAGPLYFRALAIREKAFGPNHPQVADSLQKVGLSLYFNNGRLPIAMPLFSRALEIRKKAFGQDNLAVADSLSTMAFVHDLHNDRTSAIPLYQEALEIREKILPPDDPEVLQTLYNLGMAYSLEREYGKAIVLNQRRLKSLEAKLGPDDPEVASALEILVFTLRNAGKEAEAKILSDQAKQIREKAKGRVSH